MSSQKLHTGFLLNLIFASHDLVKSHSVSCLQEVCQCTSHHWGDLACDGSGSRWMMLANRARTAWQMDPTLGETVLMWCKTRGQLSSPQIIVREALSWWSHRDMWDIQIVGSLAQWPQSHSWLFRGLSVKLVPATFGAVATKIRQLPLLFICVDLCTCPHIKTERSTETEKFDIGEFCYSSTRSSFI